VLEVLHDSKRFSSRVMAPADPVLLGADEPGHAAVRQALDRALAAETDSRLALRIAWLADDVAHGLDGRERPDLVADFCRPLSLMVMAEILGLDASYWGDLGRWADTVLAEATGNSPTPAFDGGSPGAGVRLADALAVLETSPAHGVVNRLANDSYYAVRGSELTSVCRLLVVAGSETTAHLIGLSLLAALGDEKAVSIENAETARALVKRVLRTSPPVQHVMRVATEPCRLNETLYPEGTLIVARLTAPEGDPAAASGRHWSLPFGAGVHSCPGSALALLEATVALESLWRRWPDLSAAEPLSTIPFRGTAQVTGPAWLHVHLRQTL
jgi:cytochrome P450